MPNDNQRDETMRPMGLLDPMGEQRRMAIIERRNQQAVNHVCQGDDTAQEIERMCCPAEAGPVPDPGKAFGGDPFGEAKRKGLDGVLETSDSPTEE